MVILPPHLQFLLILTIISEGLTQIEDELGFCEHGVRKSLSSLECSEDILINVGYQDCLCFAGVFYIEYHHNCHFEMVWSAGGCEVPRLAQVYNGLYDAAYRSLYGAFEPSSVMAAIPSFYDDEVTLSWDLIIMGQGSKMSLGGYFLNSKVFLDPDTNIYCTCPTHENGTVYSFSGLRGLVSLTLSCTGIQQVPDFSFPILTAETSNCDLTCDLQRDLALRRPPVPSAPGFLRSLHNSLNRLLLQTSIDIAFQPEARTFNQVKSFKPLNTFKILDQMLGILRSSCTGARIPNRFLDNLMMLFKYVHEGRGYYFPEQFTNPKSGSITKMLRHCEESLVPLKFGFDDDCSGKITSVYGSSAKEGKIRIQKSPGHEDFEHYHVLLDMIWNIVDFYNVACIESFSISYRIYHELEQGMEQLFTEELRNLWVYPDIPKHFYDRIFGPTWELYVENLDKCIEGAYVLNPKLARLLRPTWITGKRRLKNKRMMLENNEVVCGVRKCSRSKGPQSFLRIWPSNHNSSSETYKT